jgi:hypothetical protein
MTGACAIERGFIAVGGGQSRVGSAAGRNRIVDGVRAGALGVARHWCVRALEGARFVAARSDGTRKVESIAKAHADGQTPPPARMPSLGVNNRWLHGGLESRVVNRPHHSSARAMRQREAASRQYPRRNYSARREKHRMPSARRVGGLLGHAARRAFVLRLVLRRHQRADPRALRAAPRKAWKGMPLAGVSAETPSRRPTFPPESGNPLRAVPSSCAPDVRIEEMRRRARKNSPRGGRGLKVAQARAWGAKCRACQHKLALECGKSMLFRRHDAAALRYRRD